MKTFWLILAILAGGAALIAGIDMLRFAIAKRRAENPKAIRVHAGGEVYLQGGKTYYRLPKGEVRKIAEYPMDLRAGSRDMMRLTSIMDQAHDEHERERAAQRAQADKAMREIADEAARRA